MAEEDDASKTEDPSGRKLEKGREEGQVASSNEVRNWVVMLGGTLGVLILSRPMMRDVEKVMLPFVAQAEAIPMDLEHLEKVFLDLSLQLAVILAPLLGMFLLLGYLGNVVQTGLVYSPKKLEPKMERISPLAGFKRLFSMKAVIEFVKGLLKIAIVSGVCGMMAMPFLKDFDFLISFEMIQFMERVHELVLRLVIGAFAVMTVIAVLDFAYQRFSFMKEMRMTKHEVKEEYKQQEGDPQIKARIRRIRTERARKRMMAAVPTADVVITNPTHFAVALSYKMNEMEAPRLVAKGVDHIAFRIRQIAEENEVPIVENPPLARALYATVELDQEIPPEHYKAVAEVIGYVMRLRGDLPQQAGATR
jgi:flagellar biosynthetic protein FlhB